MQVGEAIARQGSLVHGCAGRSVAMHRIAKQLSKFGDATCFFPLNKQRVSLPPSSLASVASSPVFVKAAGRHSGHGCVHTGDKVHSAVSAEILLIPLLNTAAGSLIPLSFGCGDAEHTRLMICNRTFLVELPAAVAICFTL